MLFYWYFLEEILRRRNDKHRGRYTAIQQDPYSDICAVFVFSEVFGGKENRFAKDSKD